MIVSNWALPPDNVAGGGLVVRRGVVVLGGVPLIRYPRMKISKRFSRFRNSIGRSRTGACGASSSTEAPAVNHRHPLMFANRTIPPSLGVGAWFVVRGGVLVLVWVPLGYQSGVGIRKRLPRAGDAVMCTAHRNPR